LVVEDEPLPLAAARPEARSGFGLDQAIHGCGLCCISAKHLLPRSRPLWSDPSALRCTACCATRAGCRGGDLGRWTLRVSLRRATWRRWWPRSLVIWMARSRRREVLELTMLWQVLLPDRVLETGLGGDGRSDLSGVREGFFRAKAQCFDANGGNSCRYCYPLGGAIAATFTMLGLRVKILDRLGLNVGGGCIVTLLRASLWSSDFSQTCVDVFGGKSWFFLYSLVYFDLLCKRISSSPYIGSVVVWLYL
jgi:hypothetical protein